MTCAQGAMRQGRRGVIRVSALLRAGRNAPARSTVRSASHALRSSLCRRGTSRRECENSAVQLAPQIRPYLMADGGNVEFVEIDGPVVYLRLQGACGSCPSSLTTMTMGIKRRLMEKIPVRLCQ